MLQKIVLPTTLIFVFLLFFSCSSFEDDLKIIPNEPSSENPVIPEPIINIITADGNTLVFGKRVPGKENTQTLIIENTGDAPLEVSSIDLSEGYISNWNSSAIPAGGSQEVIVTFNPSEVKTYEGTLTIYSNSNNNENTIDLQGFGVSEVYEGNIALGNQNDVDDFGAIGYTQITGELCIGGYCEVDMLDPYVVDLSSLNGMLSVSTLRVATNPELETLEGLNNIKVENYLSILFNTNLKNLDAILDMPFNVLPAGFQIAGNTSIQNIDGLQKINSAGGSVRILMNDNLENIDGLSNLISIGQSLAISYNPLLANLNGLSSLEIVGENISLRYNKALFNYCGIKMLLETGGYSNNTINMKFNRYNPTINEIVTADCEFEVPSDTYYGDLDLYRQDDIDFIAEQGFSKVIGNLVFNGVNIQDYALSFTDFSTLTEISGSLSIINTGSLENLKGFENLTSVGGNIDISRNLNLIDFCDLVPLLKEVEGFSGNYTVQDNMFNPTQLELENGSCSQ